MGSCPIRVMRYEAEFTKIEIGQQRPEVINLMGDPSAIKGCIVSKYDGDSSHGKDCFEIYGYYTVFKYWAIAFDQDGKVIKKFRWAFDDGYGAPEGFGFPVTFW